MHMYRVYNQTTLSFFFILVSVDQAQGIKLCLNVLENSALMCCLLNLSWQSSIIFQWMVWH